MPIYEYACKKCHQHFEVTQKISDAPVSKCPACKGEVKRLISSTSFALKGGGWYKDGYASGSKGASKEVTDKSASSAGKKAKE